MLPKLDTKAIDIVNRIERMRWIPRVFVRIAVSCYISLFSTPGHRKILNSVSKGDVVIDLGANVGIFTSYFASRGARVLAFEPDPHAFAILGRATKGFGNVTRYNKAVFDKSGEMLLYRHQNFDKDPNYCQSSSLIGSKANVQQDRAVSVEVVDIHDVVNSLGRIKLLKIDIEGAELEIIERLLETGDIQNIEHILVETHEDVVPGLGARLDTLKTKLSENNLTNVDFSWH